MSRSELLALEAVTVRFVEARALPTLRPAAPLRVALDRVDLALRAGEIVALLGANGAGKSTLLRVAAGLVHPESGAVRAPGRAGFGTADERSFYWRLSARENLRFFGALAGGPAAARGRVEALLRRVGLGDRAETPVRALSAGMRARLALARALLADPPVLLLDEIERGLDAGARAELRRLLADWGAAGDRAALVATHDLDHAGPFTRAVVLEAGRVVSDGPFATAAATLAERLGADAADPWPEAGGP